MATREPLETDVKASNGKTMTAAKQYIGTPFLVQCRKNFGALPSSDREYRFRTAQ
jgi:hypothetical protein